MKLGQPAGWVDAAPSSPRVELCPAQVGDAADLLEFERMNRAYFERLINGRGDAFYTQENVRQTLEKAEQNCDAGLAYAYLVRVGDELAGRVNLTDVERQHFHVARLGYRIGEAWCGRGVATSAVGMAVERALGEHRLYRIEATVAAYNRGSARVLEKNGFEVFGLAKRSFLHGGAWHDLIYYERRALAPPLLQGA